MPRAGSRGIAGGGGNSTVNFDAKRPISSGVSPSPPDTAELEQAFLQIWHARLERALPGPSILLGLWILSRAPRPGAVAAVIVCFILVNTALTRLELGGMAPHRGSALRGACNGLLLFAVSLAGGPSGSGALLAFITVFGALFSPSRATTYLIILACSLGAGAGSLTAGTSAGTVTAMLLPLWVTGFLAEQIYLPLKAAYITSQRQQQQLEDALQFRKTFLATMSHEIRTPMNGVLGMTELLRDTPLGEQQREMVDTVLRSGQGLMQILDDILDLSKLEARQMRLEDQPYDPGAVLEEATGLMRPAAADRGVALVASAEGLPLAASGDGMRLRQVLLNLLSNAIKFTEEGTVRVQMCWADDVLHATVSDTGIGMRAETLSRLFTPFEQADASTSRRFGGTGLGLAISRQLIEQMGGQITAESALGQGSTFRVTLPAPAVTPQTRAPSMPPPGGAGLELRVLVVDDHPINLRVATAMLERSGCTVITAASGAEALAADLTGIDLVLMDCQMPELDGFETTQRMRARGTRLPILALTAGVTDDERDRCLSCGMDAVLAKPLRREALTAALAAHTSRKTTA